eukprot:1139426-Pyramimonas_sp.AAC.1
MGDQAALSRRGHARPPLARDGGSHRCLEAPRRGKQGRRRDNRRELQAGGPARNRGVRARQSRRPTRATRSAPGARSPRRRRC